MTPIFNVANKGKIAQNFGVVNPHNGNFHTGIDHLKGFGQPIYCDNEGLVYKVIKAGELESNWAAVYMLVEDGINMIEVCYGHLSRIDVKEGQYIKKNQQVGLEGNRGEVYYKGERITAAMQKAGDTRGSHVHESWRPVRIVKSVTPKEHYLLDKKGNRYKSDGGYFEVMFNDLIGDNRGMIDPYIYRVEDVKRRLQLQVIELLQTLKRLTT